MCCAGRPDEPQLCLLNLNVALRPLNFPPNLYPNDFLCDLRLHLSKSIHSPSIYLLATSHSVFPVAVKYLILSTSLISLFLTNSCFAVSLVSARSFGSSIRHVSRNMRLQRDITFWRRRNCDVVVSLCTAIELWSNDDNLRTLSKLAVSGKRDLRPGDGAWVAWLRMRAARAVRRGAVVRAPGLRSCVIICMM